MEHLDRGTDEQELRTQIEELRDEMTAGPNEGFQAVEDAASQATEEPTPESPSS